MKRALLILAISLFAALAPLASAQRNLSPPTFKPGDTFFYRVHLKIDRNIQAKSAISIPQAPSLANMDVLGILQVEVLPHAATTGPAGAIRLRTWFLALVGEIIIRPRGSKPGAGYSQRVPAEDKFIDCLLTPAGSIEQITGLDALAPEQQQAWQEWATRFAGAVLIATEKRKRGDKWSSEEPETAPSPVAELRWQKKLQYIHDESCAPLKVTRNGEFQRATGSDSCAVIVATAALVQKSSARDSTPLDYKQHDLRTSGTAAGTNDVILSVSRKTGHLIRATQNAEQKMDVIIALADGTTRVHYNVTAKASSSVEFVTDLPLILQPKSSKE